MIRHPVDFDELERAVDAAHPTWRARAAEAVARMWASSPREFDPTGPSWSEIKALYMVRQHHKCAYCERGLEAEDYGSIEHDVEHYRPKREVSPWPAPGYLFSVHDGNPRGYCMLGYELRNYCVACKTCNSVLKRSHFPIAGRRGRVDARDIKALNRRERPLLLYPLGDVDEDPERLLGFVGVEPVPMHSRGHRHHRARVTLDLFRLGEREELRRARAATIRDLWWMLRTMVDDEKSKDERRRAREDIELRLDGSEPHTACARAFVALFIEQPNEAYAFYEAAREQLRRGS